MHVVVIGGWAPSLIKFRGPLLAALVARGHRVTAIAGDATPAVRDRLAALGVELRALGLERAGLDPRRDLRTLAELVRALRELAPDTVFAYTIKPVIYGLLAARIVGVPNRAAMITGLGYALTNGGSPKQRLITTIARGLYRLALAGCHVLFVQNPDDHVDLAKLGVLPPGLRIELVRGSGVDLDHYAVSALPESPLRFLFLGRLLRDKGIAELVTAASAVRRAHPDVRFRVAGWLDPNPESASRRDVDDWVASGAIEYLGDLEDVRPALRDAHALVLPSYREGTPRSVLEAMAMGRAVVTTDAPGCRETVVDGVSGLIVPVGDAIALEKAIARLVDDPALLARLASAGRQRAEQLYDARLVAAQMVDAMGL